MYTALGIWCTAPPYILPITLQATREKLTTKGLQMSCNSLTEIKQKGCFEECTDNDAEQSRTAFIIFRYTPPTRREEVMLPHICIAENHKA